MPSNCCSSVDFLQSLHRSPIQFSFAFLMHLLMLFFTSLYFSDPSGSNRFFLSSFLLLHRSEFLQWPRVFSFDDVCQGSHWLFHSLLCWRWWSLNPGLYLLCSWWWEVQTSHLSWLGRFPTHWDLSAFRGQTWVLFVLACWFFSGEGRRSSSASRGHFQCLLLENFVFLQCSLLIGSSSSLECNQSSCGVIHLGYARSIFWMLCDDQKCSPTQDR